MSLFDGKAERFLPCFLTLVGTFRSSAKVDAGSVELVDDAGGPVASVVDAGAVELVDDAGGVGTAEDKSTWTVKNIKKNK